MKKAKRYIDYLSKEAEKQKLTPQKMLDDSPPTGPIMKLRAKFRESNLNVLPRRLRDGLGIEEQRWL